MNNIESSPDPVSRTGTDDHYHANADNPSAPVSLENYADDASPRTGLLEIFLMRTAVV